MTGDLLPFMVFVLSQGFLGISVKKCNAMLDFMILVLLYFSNSHLSQMVLLQDPVKKKLFYIKKKKYLKNKIHFKNYHELAQKYAKLC